MRELIGFCGLDCEKCQARIATKNNDDKLRKQVADEWSKLNGILITPEMINCDGCRVNGVKTPFCDKLCTIQQCALKNGKETCGACSLLDTCDKVAMIIANNSEASANLKCK